MMNIQQAARATCSKKQNQWRAARSSTSARDRRPHTAPTSSAPIPNTKPALGSGIAGVTSNVVEQLPFRPVGDVIIQDRRIEQKTAVADRLVDLRWCH